MMSSAAEVSFNTDAGAIYVIERVAKPLGSYTYSHVEGAVNQGAKRLPNTQCSLGN